MSLADDNPRTEKSMRVVFPSLYHYITEQLEEQHIHPYDIQASIAKEENGYQVIIRFGEGFTHTQKQSFSLEEIENMDSKIASFVKETSTVCKEVMIADYFKMMKA